MSLFKSAFTVGGLTLCSRVLGYIRDILFAKLLGSSAAADAFFVAFRLPNFFRQLSAEGAFNNAFVPLFSGKLAEEGKEKACLFAGNVLGFMLFFLLFVIIAMQLSMPWVMRGLAPGFVGDEAQFSLVVQLGYIMFPYLLFISLVAFFGGMLNSIGTFSAFAAAPIWLNVTMIIALLFIVPNAPEAVIALSWAVFVAGIIQLLWMIAFALRHNVLFLPQKPRLDSQMKTLLKRMVPGVIGGSVMQINLWVNTLLATLIPGAVSYLYYADRLVQFPLAIIATAMGTALLPNLSQSIRLGQHDASMTTLNKGLELMLLLTLPAAIGLMVLAEPIIQVMFERGAFTSATTSATAKALFVYGMGLPAFGLVKIFAPVFFAHGDTKTPVKVAALCLIFNVIAGLILMRFYSHVGLAMATSLASWCNAILLGVILRIKGHYIPSDRLKKKLLAMMAACLSMAGGIIGALKLYSFSTHTTLTSHIVALGLFITLGMVIYFMCLAAIGGYRISDLRKVKR